MKQQTTDGLRAAPFSNTWNLCIPEGHSQSRNPLSLTLSAPSRSSALQPVGCGAFLCVPAPHVTTLGDLLRSAGTLTAPDGLTSPPLPLVLCLHPASSRLGHQLCFWCVSLSKGREPCCCFLSGGTQLLRRCAIRSVQPRAFSASHMTQGSETEREGDRRRENKRFQGGEKRLTVWDKV